MGLTYWVVLGIFEIVDHFAGFILAIIPFYYVLKMFAIIFLFHPSTNGATWVYDNWLRPHLLEGIKHVNSFEKQVTDTIDSARGQVHGVYNKVRGTKAE